MDHGISSSKSAATIPGAPSKEEQGQRHEDDF